ncbi:hypothetical protein [Helicobacter apodemus]|uniref:Uncharacterized protein n=1 Tax=Helicobacter apodemus TaxID=135569 RepID=A0A2U8FDS1_9HELI|nr:hypothetical protein [Helicobacter apodemus]AWI34400.1 hypothetical protein CDV25_06225 [Helicobacter apodemus]
MKKLFNVMAILSFLSMVAFAEDFLAKVTNGALSDYDKGVRLLSAEEEGRVVGDTALLGILYMIIMDMVDPMRML